MRRGERAVIVRGEEDGTAVANVVVRESEFEVIDVEVETYEDDADFRVEGGTGCYFDVVGRGDGAAERGVGAADVWDGEGGEFGFDTGFADDEDFGMGWWEVQDTRDVDCGGVGGAEYFFLQGVRKSKGMGQVGVDGRQWRGCPFLRVSFDSRHGIWCCCS